MLAILLNLKKYVKQMKESEKEMQFHGMEWDRSAFLVSRMGWLRIEPKHKVQPHLFWIVGFK